MSRHTKNNTSHQVFTHYERSIFKDVGTIKTRLSGDSQRKFEECCLCLRVARNPVATPHGVLYCKNCIIINLGSQREKMEKQRKLWIIEKERIEEQNQKKIQDFETRNMERFVNMEEDAIIRTNNNAVFYSNIESSSLPLQTENLMERDILELRKKSFWISQNAPEGFRIPPEKPKTRLECPVTRKPLRLKDLITLKPVLFDEDNEESSRWICCVSNKVINHQRAVVSKLDGSVLLKEYADKYMLGKNKILGVVRHVKKEDFIELLTGGTSFSSHNTVEAFIMKPVMGGN